MFKTFLLLFTTSSILSSGGYSQSKAAGLAEFLPEDILFAMEVDDLDQLKKSLSQGPMGRLVDFPIWQKLSKLLKDELNLGLNNKSNEKLEEIHDNLFQPVIESSSGSIVFGIGNFDNLVSSESIEDDDGSLVRHVRKMPTSALILESSISRNQYSDMVSWMKEKSKSSKNIFSKYEIKEENLGEIKTCWIILKSNLDLSDLEPKETGICISLHKGKLFLLSGGEEVIKSIIERNGKNPDSLVKHRPYLDCFDEIGRGQARMFINFGEGMRSMEEITGSEEMELPQNPFGVSLESLVKGLGLDGLDFFGVQLNASTDSFEVTQSLGLNHRDGLLSLLAPASGELVNHDFIPSNVFTLSNSKQDLGTLWTKIETTIKRISPALHLLVTSQIQAFEDQAEVAVRDDLLGSLGDELVSISFLNQNQNAGQGPANPTSEIFVIGLTDSLLFDRSIRAVVDSVSQGNELFKEREHRGVTVRSIRGMESTGLSISYAIVEDWLLLSMGESRYINQLISKMRKNEKPFWESSHVAEAMTDVPNRVRQISYVDFSEIFSFFQVIFESLDIDDVSFTKEDFGELPYFMLSWAQDTDRGITSKGRIYPFEK